MVLDIGKISTALAGLSVFYAVSAQADPIRLLGFDAPPMSSVSEGKKLSGPGYDFVTDLFKASGLPFVAEGLPISRVFPALDEGNAVVVFLVRNPAREDKYAWLGDIVPDDGFAFMTRVGDAPILSFEQAKTLKAVSALGSAAPAQVLRNNGLMSIDETVNEALNLKKLVAGRVDAWFSGAIIARHMINADAEAAKTIVIGPKLVPTPYWIAGSKTLPADVVNKLQQAFAATKTNGRYAAFRAQID
jgi:polar amino acid transport system substrate-binding protein